MLALASPDWFKLQTLDSGIQAGVFLGANKTSHLPFKIPPPPAGATKPCGC